MRVMSEPIATTGTGGGTIPALLALVPAGWPSPADEYVEKEENLHTRLVHNPLSTFTMTASGDSMTGVGIMDGATLVVDRSVDPYNGAVVIAEIDGELFVKRLEFREKRAFLVPANPDYPERDVTDREDFRVWGVVIHCINSFRVSLALRKPAQPQDRTGYVQESTRFPRR